MEKEEKLQELTNNFLEEFFRIASEGEERDDLFHFNFTLAETIGKSNFPKYEEQMSLLMGMSSFDDSIAKVMFNHRIQGFVKIIEDKLTYKGEQEDYYLKNVKVEEVIRDDFKLKFFKNEKGENTFKSIECKKKVEVTTFDVSNSRNSFSGNVVLKKEIVKHFTSPNDFEERLTVVSVDFFTKNERIMTIDYKYNFDTNEMYEEGSFTHYKHIADINSFYVVLCCI